MSKHAGRKMGWWPRCQQILAALVLMTGQAARVAEYLRQIIR